MNEVRDDPGNTIHVLRSDAVYNGDEHRTILVSPTNQGVSGARPGDEDEGDRGAVRQRLRGGIVPSTPLGPGMAVSIFIVCLFMFLIALALMSVGSAVYVILDVRSTTQGPAMWWTGFLPLILAICGIHISMKGSRYMTWNWSVATILCVLTQVAVMGVVGNFSTSFYDAWPPKEGICRHFHIHDYCFCQDYYHGPYSQIELPDVTYIYRDDIKWRQTRFNHCDDVVLMNKLFLCNIGLTVSFGLCGILGAAIGICGSVCATQDSAMEIFTVNSEQNIRRRTDSVFSSTDRELQPIGILPSDIDINDTIRLM